MKTLLKIKSAFLVFFATLFSNNVNAIENLDGHENRDIFSAANKGFAEISKQVENFDQDADGMVDADGEDYDILVDFDNEYASLVRRGTPNARSLAVNTMTNRYGPRFTSAMNRRLASLGSGSGGGKKMKRRNLPYKMKRTSYNLVGIDLPFVLGAVVSKDEEYRSIINSLNLLDATIQLDSVKAINGKMVFQYSDKATGLLIDKVEISSGNGVPYTTQLEMTRSITIVSPGFKYTTQKGNFESQFNIDVFNGHQTLFGFSGDAGESTTSYKSTGQFQDAIINFSSEVEWDSCEFLASAMSAVAPGVGLLGEIKWDVRVTQVRPGSKRESF